MLDGGTKDAVARCFFYLGKIVKVYEDLRRVGKVCMQGVNAY